MCSGDEPGAGSKLPGAVARAESMGSGDYLGAGGKLSGATARAESTCSGDNLERVANYPEQ